MKILPYIVFFLLSQVLPAQIRVSLFNSFPVKGLVVSAYNGKYSVYCENEKLYEFAGKRLLYITLYNNGLLVNDANGTLGYYENIEIRPESDSAKLLLSLTEPKANGRIYTGSIGLRIDYGRILVLNEINTEGYIAGVVETETGINALPEFYKAQALLCRTYLYSHIDRHESEGFNLCDEVHCQAYKGNTPFTFHVFSSTSKTAGMAIFSPENEYITAAFHANCGGKTESSLNVWLKPENYLVPVTDPHCQNSNNARWEKKIPVSEWKKYLADNGFKASLTSSGMEMSKPGRQIYYRVNKDSLLTKQIRADWNLKSSFFRVLIKNNVVHITGNGYGHGVGLCQDGAMSMARKGFKYDAIINFYFKNVYIGGVK